MLSLLADGGGMTGAVQLLDELDAVLDEPVRITEETWGTGSRAVAGGRAMMDAVGGPSVDELVRMAKERDTT